MSKSSQNDDPRPSTSTGDTTNLRSTEKQQHMNETIENVIQQMRSISSSDDEEEQHDNNCEYQWQKVTGLNLKKINFDEERTGFRADLYETMFNKTPYDFYKLFVNDDIINLMVNIHFVLCFLFIFL